jgi:RNA polymerase sigma-70 factor, ECF subfamily
MLHKSRRNRKPPRAAGRMCDGQAGAFRGTIGPAMSRETTSPGGLEDGALVRRIGAAPRDSAGDEAELCRRFAPRIRLYGRRHLRDEHAASDLVQDVLAAVIEAVRAGRIEDPDRLRQFVLGTCRFVAWRMRRGEWRRDETVQRAHLEAVGGSEAGSWAALDAERLERCLGGLPPRERKVLYMSFYEDRTAQEIGAALALTDVHVRVIRHRALERLRDCVDARPGDHEAPR